MFGRAFKSNDKEKVGPRKYISQKEYITFIMMIFLLVGSLILIFSNVLNPSGNKDTKSEDMNSIVPVKQSTITMPEREQLDNEARTAELNAPKEPAAGEKETKPPAEKWTANPSIWDNVADYTLDTEEPEPFWYLVHKMNSMTDKELENAAVPFKRGQYEEMLKYFSSYREKVIEINGRLMDLHPRELLDCQAMVELTGVKRIWAAVIVNSDYNVFQVYLTERRPGLTGALRWGVEGSSVRCKAAFMKAHRYTNLYGGKQNCILLVGKFLEPGREVKREDVYSQTMLIIVVAIIGITALIIFILVVRDRRDNEKFEREFRQKHPKKISNEFIRQHVVRRDGQTPGEDSTPPDSSSDYPGGGSAPSNEGREKGGGPAAGPPPTTPAGGA
jgi:preprotein translocase subunit SecG